jgi:peptide/nickel transport system ATP-binding protein
MADPSLPSDPLPAASLPPVPLLEVRDLRTSFGSGANAVHAVDGISFTIQRGQTLGLIGESGSGKSITALSLLRLLPAAARITGGNCLLDGQDLLDLPEYAMQRIRGRRIAMIFQEPQTSLNPVMRIGDQIGEVLVRHQGLAGAKLQARAAELLEAVGIPNPGQRLRDYPHQYSGGMKQRVMIAMALAGAPDLLIADEPTTALDVTIQAQILDLLQELQKTTGMAILFITHDLGIAARMVDDIAVMKEGRIVEAKARAPFFRAPEHPYSQALFAAVPGRTTRARDDAALAEAIAAPPASGGLVGGAATQLAPPEAGVEAAAGQQLLEVRDLKVYFPIRKGIFRRVVGQVKAVDGVSISVPAGRTVAVVGESGSGKTTMGKGILRLLAPAGGSVRFAGEDLLALPAAAMRRRRAAIQVVFQDPFASMNPRMMVSDIVQEGMIAQGVGGATRAERERRVDELLGQVRLLPEHKYRYPHEFSGGQRQRICIARALAVEPRLIVCDEPTSALDVSVQAEILKLLRELQRRLGLAYLFITHNLGVVEYLAHEVVVLYQGRIVEQGPVEEVLNNPQHPYTQRLLAAVPRLDPACVDP